MPKIVIRSVRQEDLPSLWDIDTKVMTINEDPNRVFPADYDEFVHRLLKVSTLVAVAPQGKILGFLDYSYVLPIEMHGKQWNFEVAVDQAAQGLGVGKKLLHHLLVNAQAEKIVKISLRVLGTNPNAIGFYEHFGFQQEGHYKKEFFLNGRWVDDYQYALYYPYLNE